MGKELNDRVGGRSAKLPHVLLVDAVNSLFLLTFRFIRLQFDDRLQDEVVILIRRGLPCNRILRAALHLLGGSGYLMVFHGWLSLTLRGFLVKVMRQRNLTLSNCSKNR